MTQNEYFKIKQNIHKEIESYNETCDDWVKVELLTNIIDISQKMGPDFFDDHIHVEYYQRGLLFTKLEKHIEAMNDILEAIELSYDVKIDDKTLAGYYKILGYNHQKLGNTEKVNHCYDIARYLDPSFDISNNDMPDDISNESKPQ